MVCDAETIGKYIRFLNFLGGVCLSGLGVLRFIWHADMDGIEMWVLSFYYCLFGMKIILCELGFRFIIDYFSFLASYTGRGLFLIFCGILCFDRASFDNKVERVNWIAGALICFFGCCCLIYAWNSDARPGAHRANDPKEVETANKV